MLVVRVIVVSSGQRLSLTFGGDKSCIKCVVLSYDLCKKTALVSNDQHNLETNRYTLDDLYNTIELINIFFQDIFFKISKHPFGNISPSSPALKYLTLCIYQY